MKILSTIIVHQASFIMMKKMYSLFQTPTELWSMSYCYPWGQFSSLHSLVTPLPLCLLGGIAIAHGVYTVTEYSDIRYTPIFFNLMSHFVRYRQINTCVKIIKKRIKQFFLYFAYFPLSCLSVQVTCSSQVLATQEWFMAQFSVASERWHEMWI